MFTNTKSILNGILLLLAFGLVMGCAHGPKTPPGGHATAEKDEPVKIDDGKLPENPEKEPVQVPINELDPENKYNMCPRIHFDYDKYEIKAEWNECLNNIARFLKDRESITLIIEGNCDERGSDEYNMALGEKRANATAEFLIGKGISAERIVTKSWGESRPLASGHDENSWKLNRRSDFFGVDTVTR